MKTIGVSCLLMFVVLLGLGLTRISMGFGNEEEKPLNQAIPPKGEYAKIDIAISNEALALLKSGTKEEKQIVIKTIQEKPQAFIPYVFCAISEILFDEGQKDEAAFWYYAGDLRCHFDAARCTDISAREGVAVIEEQFGKRIDQYCAQNPTQWKTIIEKVIAWDRKTPYHYDQRWINLHGMKAILASMDMDNSSEPMSLPKEQWEEIAEKNRIQYLKNFEAELKLLQ